MKAQRRHQLEHNDFADWLEAKGDQLRPYWQSILAGGLAVLIALGAYWYLKYRRDVVAQDAATQLQAALAIPQTEESVLGLEAVAADFAGTPLAIFAHLAAADRLLAEGVDALFTDRAAANAQLTQAREHYQAVVDGAHEPHLVARALLGLGKSFESLNQLQDARNAYERLASDFQASPEATAAQARLSDLSRQETLEFYDWFAQQEPAPQLPDSPILPGGDVPFDPSALPDTPIDLDGDSVLSPDAGGATEDDLPEGDAPLLPGATEPATDTPAESSESPAADAALPASDAPDTGAAPEEAAPSSAPGDAAAPQGEPQPEVPVSTPE